jgi:plastocyanin
LFALACAAAAWAGQVRVNVSNFAFTPASVSANLGDHIVWIWTGGSHTVTSGDRLFVSSELLGDGHFNTSPDGSPYLLATFSWKVDFTGTEPYYCQPHPGMNGTLTLTPSGTSGLSDFRITEVLYGDAGNLDLIEIANIGTAGDLYKYRLKVAGFAVQTLVPSAGSALAVPGGGHVVIHCGASGTSTATDLYLPVVTDVPATGSVALYVPNTLNTSLADAKQMIDFVQWGAGTQENEATAATAGFWAPGAAVAGVAAGHSIEYCGAPGQYGAARWYDNPTPNFGGSDNCTTPAFSTTWGRIKTLYR